MENCIKNCHGCYRVCLETINYCLNRGGAHAATRHMKLLMDCARICQVSAELMIRDSEYSAKICGMCADICEKCAESCENLDEAGQVMMCANVCRKCAQSCREMETRG